MRLKKKEFDIFNLSFLDVISCGFGAVVLLVLISNTSPDSSQSSLDEAESLLSQVVALETKIDTLNEEIDNQKKQNDTQLSDAGALGSAAEQLSQRLGQTQTEAQTLDSDMEGLSLVKDSLKRISIAPSSTKTTRDEEVGGIPVDSDYVIFVVDTSGSMLEIWDRVSREILNVLNIHPKVKGFQILNDQGKSLISAYSGKWIPDTPQRRKSIMNVFGAWNDASNSSPVEGVETALKIYAKPGRSMSVYVFGDDYTGGSYGPVIDQITKLNKGGGRKGLAKIHAVGFISQYTTNRFAILMRELTKRNGGTFLALPF
jgi:regulator of replication initiation timing